jgi:hypothetical protein
MEPILGGVAYGLLVATLVCTYALTVYAISTRRHCLPHIPLIGLRN